MKLSKNTVMLVILTYETFVGLFYISPRPRLTAVKYNSNVNVVNCASHVLHCDI